MRGTITNRNLSKAQREVMNKIIDYGTKNGFTDADIEIAAKAAYIESSLGNNLGPPPPAPDNPNPTASGLFAYTNGNWSDYHSDDGAKNNIDNQIKAFFEDIQTYKNRYNDPNNDIPREQIDFGEYVYIKHHDGRSYDDFLNAPGNTIWNSINFKVDVTNLLDILYPTQSIIDDFHRLYSSAFTAINIQHRDPLIIDLDGDGIETIASNAGAYFDHDGNGFAEQTGWAAPDDGLLVRDLNGNGTIDGGKELFGDHTVLKNGSNAANGFQALADLDDNHDGRIDSDDAAYSQLRVWQDIDGDGLSAPEELRTLEEIGIKSISVQSEISNTTDPEGNTQTRIGSFQKTDDTNGTIGEYNLKRDTAYTIAEDWLEVPDDIAALPDLQGSGNIYDLQQAIVRDTSGQLKSLVEQFIATTDVNARKNILDQIIFRWAGTDGIAANSRGVNMDARKLAALEKFFGQGFVGANGTNPTSAAAIPLNESYRGLLSLGM